MSLIPKSFLLVIFIILGCKTKSDHPNSIPGGHDNFAANSSVSKAPVQKEKKLLFYFGSNGPQFQNFLKQNPNVEEVKYLDEKMMINAEKVEMDYDKLKKNVEFYYPNKEERGYCYLNVEAPYLDMMSNHDQDSPQFKKGLKLYLDIIRALKKLRPNVKFGFYAIPFTTYWETQTGFFKKNDKIDLLLKEVDVFFPSFYMFYDDGVVGFIKNKEYLESNTQNAIKLGLQYNKPVYPFVMHRYHPSNKTIGWQKLSDQEWKKYISTIMSYRYEERGVDGITWWGPDSYFYGVGSLDAFKREFKGSVKQYEIYNDLQLTNKGNEVLKIFRENSKH